MLIDTLDNISQAAREVKLKRVCPVVLKLRHEVGGKSLDKTCFQTSPYYPFISGRQALAVFFFTKI